SGDVEAGQDLVLRADEHNPHAVQLESARGIGEGLVDRRAVLIAGPPLIRLAGLHVLESALELLELDADVVRRLAEDEPLGVLEFLVGAVPHGGDDGGRHHGEEDDDEPDLVSQAYSHRKLSALPPAEGVKRALCSANRDSDTKADRSRINE